MEFLVQKYLSYILVYVTLNPVYLKESCIILKVNII